MNVPPTCEVQDHTVKGVPQPCGAPAEHVVVDKMNGKILFTCRKHVGDLITEHGTFSIFPAKDYSKPAKRIVVGPRCALCDSEGHAADNKFYCHNLDCRNAWNDETVWRRHLAYKDQGGGIRDRKD